jgi:hypothetical protein
MYGMRVLASNRRESKFLLIAWLLVPKVDSVIS